MTARRAATCWLAGGVLYLALEAGAARAQSGYRYAHDFISDLGRPESPLNWAMNGALVIQGTMFLAGAVLAARACGARSARVFLVCAAANGVGNAVVATVPSGTSGVAWVHVTGAALAILGGNAAIAAGVTTVPTLDRPRWYRAASYGLAALGLTSFALLAMTTTSVSVGLPGAVLERTSVYTIIGWQLLSAGLLLSRGRAT